MRKKELRIYLILADENLFHPKYLLGLISEFQKRGHKIVGLTLALDKYKKGFLSAVLQQINLWGFLPFAFIAGNSILRTTFLSSKTMRGLAVRHKVSIVESFNVNSDDHIKYLRSKKVDIIISSNGQIFKKDLLKLSKIAAINRHSALLPSYGGVLPVFWAMKNNEKKLGTSAHYMVEEIDRGDILAQYDFKNENGVSLFGNYMKAFDISIPVTVDAVENALDKKIVKKFKRNKNQYYSFPKKDDIKKFKKNNSTFKLIDILNFYKNY